MPRSALLVLRSVEAVPMISGWHRQLSAVIPNCDVMPNYYGGILLPRHNTAPLHLSTICRNWAFRRGIRKPCHVKAT
jgi:hypothetical protein